MEKYFSNKPLYSLLLLLVFITSCGRDPSKEKASGSETIPGDKTHQKKIIEDPYFVESSDTISKHGPRNITRGMLQDKHGDYWFATWEGIIKYDGKVFTNITLKEDLRHFHAFWFGTIGGGVYKYDGKTYTNFTTKDGLAGNEIGCIMEDRSGNIWFGTTDGASKYDGNKFTNYTTLDGLKNNYVHCIAQDRTGIIWFGTDKGVCCYDGRYFINFMNNLNQPFLNVRSIIEDKNGNIWIGSEGEGLCKYDRKSLRMIKPYFTSYLLEDRTGNLWLTASGVAPTPDFPLNGTKNNNINGGMVLLKYDGKVFNKIAVKNEPNDFQIFNIYEDNTGSIWFGTMQGVCRYDPSTDSFHYFTE